MKYIIAFGRKGARVPPQPLSFFHVNFIIETFAIVSAIIAIAAWAIYLSIYLSFNPAFDPT